MIKIVTLNLQEGKSGRTVLHQTVESNNMDLVQVLLHQPGLQLDALTYDSRTALCLAVDRQLTQICCMLREAGADMSQITPDGTSETEVDMVSQTCAIDYSLCPFVSLHTFAGSSWCI